MKRPDALGAPNKGGPEQNASTRQVPLEVIARAITESLTLDGMAPAVPSCVVCGKPTLREVAGGIPRHATCDPRHTYATAPATSWAAGSKVKRGRSSLLAQRVLQLLRDEGPMTDAEIASLIPEAPYGSCSKRRLDLVRDGLVIDSGATRPTRTGNPAIVWAAK